MVDKLLEVKNLRVELQTKNGIVPVIDDLSFDLDYGCSAQSEKIAFRQSAKDLVKLDAIKIFARRQCDLRFYPTAQHNHADTVCKR